MRFSWNLVDRLIVLGFDVAIAVDRWLERRKQRKPRGLSYKDVQHQQAQIARATAKTVIIRRDDER